MAFDIKKELGLDDLEAKKDAKPPKGPRLKRPIKEMVSLFIFPILVVITLINMVLIIIIGIIALQHKPVAIPTAHIAPPHAQISTQRFGASEIRLKGLEDKISALQSQIDKQNKTEVSTTFIPKVKPSHSPNNEGDISSALDALNDQIMNIDPLNVSDEQQLYQIIDDDGTGDSVIGLIDAQTSEAKKKAYLEILQSKGNEWYQEAMSAIVDNDDDVNVCVENAEYFYNIIDQIADDNALLAAIRSKQIQLNKALSAYNKSQIAEDAPKKEPVPKKGSDWVLNRRSDSPIKKYESSKIVKQYDTDWEPNTRKRNEENRNSVIKQYKSDWQTNPSKRQEAEAE